MIKGLNQIQISNTLQISKSTVSNDVICLREQARLNMQTHLQDRLPEEYENCMAGINQVLKMSWEIATKGINSDSSNNNINSDSDRTSTVDDKTRLQALALANDCYKYKMDLVTNGVVITDAIKFVQQNKEELSKANEDKTDIDSRESGKDKENGSESTTSNKVF